MKNFRIPNYVILLLIVSIIFTMAAQIAEPWNTILFVVAIPLVLQAYKLYKDKTGKTLGKGANQAISLVLALAFMIFSGGFAGLKLPELPVLGDDPVAFGGALFDFAKLFIALATVAWGSLMALYEGVYDKLFVAFAGGLFTTRDKR